MNQSQTLLLIITILIAIVVSAVFLWNDRSKMLERKFQQQKYEQDLEMRKLALNEKKIDADLKKLDNRAKFSCINIY